MRIGSLFSGIGGLELGLERGIPGARTVWQVEHDAFCRTILARHWPAASREIDDVRTASAKNLARVDLVCGGFPCQDISVAGPGGGLTGKRSGLWYEYARIVAELRPAFVVVENVAHGRGRWLPFVRGDLEALGYRTRAFVIAAADVGAPHERRRCFVVADADGESVRERAERKPARRTRGVRERQEGEPVDERAAWHAAGASRWAAAPAIPRVDDGVSGWMDRERALGNAVVPQVAEVIGRIVARAITSAMKKRRALADIPSKAQMAEEPIEAVDVGEVDDQEEAETDAPAKKYDFPSAQRHGTDKELRADMARIVETIFVDDMEATFKRVTKSLRVGDQRSEHGVLHRALDEARKVSYDAHRLYVTAERERERWEKANMITHAAMWKSAVEAIQSDAEGKRVEPTNKAVEARIAVLYPDEWQTQEVRRVEVKLACESMSKLAKDANEHCVDLQIMLQKLRG